MRKKRAERLERRRRNCGNYPFEEEGSTGVGEPRDDVTDVLEDCIERREQGCSLDAFIEGDAWLHVHLKRWVMGAGDEPKDWCAVLDLVSLRQRERELGIGVRRTDKADVVNDCRRDEGAVLVLVREDTENSKGMEVRSVFPEVRLRLLDDCPMRFRYTGDLRWRQNLVFAPVGENWKLRPNPTLTGSAEIPDGVVERVTHALDRFSDDRTPFRRRETANHCVDSHLDLICRAVFFLGPESIRSFSLPGFGFRAKSIQMFYGPVELKPDSSEV
jgi:hypothetical protein